MGQTASKGEWDWMLFWKSAEMDFDCIFFLLHYFSLFLKGPPKVAGCVASRLRDIGR